MNITVVNGQNHKGSTYHIGKMLADKLKEEDEVQEIFLPRDMPEFCCGCTNCIMKDEKLCPHYQYMESVTKKIDGAELLIFTSPVYVYHVTGSMKALLDHYGYRWMLHRPEETMFRKQAVCISTAAGGGMKSTCKDMKHSMYYWGIPRIYTYGTAVRATSWAQVTEKKKQEIIKKINRLARKIEKNRNKIKPPLKTKGFFYLVKMMQKSGWNPADVEYWKAKGWDRGKKPWKIE